MKTVKQHTGNNWLLTIRKKVGLSQERLAEQLKMSTTAYKMAEQGRRYLSTGALLELIQLEIKISTGIPPDEHAEPHPAEHSSLAECRRRFYFLFTRESDCRRKSERLETQLKRMKGLYQKTREWLSVIEKQLEESEDDIKSEQWWKRQQQTVIRSFTGCSLPAQVLLQSRIALLNAEAELYKNMQKQLKKELPDFFLDKEKNNSEEHIEN